VQVYYFPSPNGQKISIALEEMGLVYEVVLVDITRGEQLKPEFLKISPNGRIPALTDSDVSGEPEPVVIFESGAILQYLGRRTGLFYAKHEARRSWIDAWLFWQMSGLGPMTGQVNWFKRVSEVAGRNPCDYVYSIKRYVKEVRRLYGVLEQQLQARDYICDEYSIADMACWPWIDKYHAHAGSLDDYPNIAAWRARVGARPAVQRALLVGMDQLRGSAWKPS
jgi:GST-like protein